MNTSFRGNSPKITRELLQWHGRLQREVALDPNIPIVDAHHHLHGKATDDYFYRTEDLNADLSSGHAVIGTIYVEGFKSGWRDGGPEAMRPVGEVEMIVEATRVSPQLAHGACRVAAGIVSFADLLLGDGIAPVLEAQMAASQGRLRSVRPSMSWDGGTVGSALSRMARRNAISDPGFRRGVACVQALGLSLDVWVLSHQLQDVVGLVDAFPDLEVVLCHVGGLLGVAEHRSRHASSYAAWLHDLRVLAERPNVRVKVGGMGMPMFGFGFEFEDRPATSSELALAWQPLIDACVETFGPGRCMFESNSPVDKQASGYVEIWNAFKRTTRHLSPDERRSMFYGTACEAYRLPELKRVGDAMAHAA